MAKKGAAQKRSRQQKNGRDAEMDFREGHQLRSRRRRRKAPPSRRDEPRLRLRRPVPEGEGHHTPRSHILLRRRQHRHHHHARHDRAAQTGKNPVFFNTLFFLNNLK